MFCSPIRMDINYQRSVFQMKGDELNLLLMAGGGAGNPFSLFVPSERMYF